MKINSEWHYLWRAVDHEGEALESFVTKRRDRAVTPKFMKKKMKLFGQPDIVDTVRLRSYGAAMKVMGNGSKQEIGRWKNR